LHPLHPSGVAMSATTLGWWRPANGCDHDDCSFVELDVAVWRANQDDPEKRLRGLLEALTNGCVTNATGANRCASASEQCPAATTVETEAGHVQRHCGHAAADR